MAWKFTRLVTAPYRRRIASIAAVACLVAGALVVSSAIGRSAGSPFSGWADRGFNGIFGGGNPPATAHSYTYTTPDSGSLAVDPESGVLSQDGGGPLQLTAYTQPQHGAVTVQPDGSFQYTPFASYTGPDSFTYTVSNAVHLYTDHLPSLGTVGGVDLNAGGYGSSMYPDPGHPGYFYGLEDRGPNVSSSNSAIPSTIDVEPIPDYDPSIGLFKFVGADAVLIRKIPLTAADGHPYSGLVNSGNPTGEQIENLNGQVFADDPNGYDSEGLVAMPDGTFWVSDEYGPYITHFDAYGRQIQRLSPFTIGQNGDPARNGLPAELRYRVPNRGLEGLTITPDGKELVALMQSSLQQPDIGGTNAKKLVPLRLVTYNLRTGAEHEYLYLLHNPATTGTAVSELTALSDTTFLVDERDSNWPGPGAFKQLFKIDISGATDIGPDESVNDPGHTVTYNGIENAAGTAPLGLLIDGQSIEKLVDGDAAKSTTQTRDVQTLLQNNGITPVGSSLYVDLNALLGSLDPNYGFYSHDKIEGVAALDGGQELVISNDSDFGLADFEGTGTNSASPPFHLIEKVSPVTGQEDNGEYLAIDMDRVNPTAGAVPTSTSTGTVTIDVSGS
jgi:hypothetical protein